MVSYKLNIVVTAFNNEKYIEECLNSIIRQRDGYNDFRVTIGYDLGSKDKTLNICEEYVKNYDFIFMKKYPNTWVGVVRNNIARETEEPYITFVDGDDRLPGDAIKKMMNEALMYNSDCVIGLMELLLIKGNKRIWPMFMKDSENEVYNNSLHSVLYSTSLFNERLYCLETVRTHEDRRCGHLITKFAKNLRIINEVIYTYVIRPTSLIRNNRERIVVLQDILVAWEDLVKYKKLFTNVSWELITEDITWSAISTLLFVYSIEDEEQRLTAALEYIDILNEHFSTWKNHKTIKKLKNYPFVKEYINILTNDNIGKDYIDFTNSYKMKIIEFTMEKVTYGGWIDAIIIELRELLKHI